MQEWRYEIKMICEEQLLPQVRSWVRLDSAYFALAYPTRRVNTLYFDTPHLNSFEANVTGVSKRQKLRLRWYGETKPLVERPTVELKFKENMLGGKMRYRLRHSLNLAESWRTIRQTIQDELLTEDPLLHRLMVIAQQPTLLNYYQREYYMTADQRVRVTLDYGIRLFDQRFQLRPNYRFPLGAPQTLIVEFKANQADGEYLQEIVGRFPLKRNRNSKYVNGLMVGVNAS